VVLAYCALRGGKAANTVRWCSVAQQPSCNYLDHGGTATVPYDYRTYALACLQVASEGCAAAALHLRCTQEALNTKRAAVVELKAAAEAQVAAAAGKRARSGE
jgi:hypothetical protein